MFVDPGKAGVFLAWWLLGDSGACARRVLPAPEEGLKAFHGEKRLLRDFGRWRP